MRCKESHSAEWVVLQSILKLERAYRPMLFCPSDTVSSMDLNKREFYILVSLVIITMLHSRLA